VPHPPSGTDRHRVYKSMFRPLTLCGVERRYFFLALLLGAATFNLFYSLLAGTLMFALVYAVARASIAVDPQLLRIVMRSVVGRSRYDAARWEFGTHKR
jgi:type IV secretory pathway TrbD component